MIIASAQNCSEGSLTGSLAVFVMLTFFAFLDFLLGFAVFCLVPVTFFVFDLSDLGVAVAGRIILFVEPGVGSLVHVHTPLFRAQAWPVLAVE